MAEGFALFDTAIGPCGIAWGVRGIVGVQLPEDGEGATRARMRRRFPRLAQAGPPADVQAACDGIGALLQGEPRDLAEIVLDYEGVPDFNRRVYEIARRIAPGHTRTYGEIAAELGDKGLSRAVGQALGHNPFAPVVPCHRVLAAGGKPGGFSAHWSTFAFGYVAIRLRSGRAAHGGAASKLRMLMIEGARPPADGTEPLF